MPNRKQIRRAKALELVQQIARMQIEGETDADGREYSPEGNDSEIEALYRLIEEARRICAD